MEIIVTINHVEKTLPRAVSVGMEELVGLSLTEAHNYIDSKVRQFVAETVSYSWAVEKRTLPIRDTEQVAA